MKKEKIITIMLSCIAIFILCCFFINKITINNIIKTQYTKSLYSIPSINKNGIIYLDKNLNQDVDLSIIPECLKINEKSHKLKYQKVITIIICEDDQASGRIFKIFKTKASGFAFSDNLIILNYNNLYKLGYTFESIIKHESSHTLIKQNIKSFITMILTFSNRSLWFSEGFASYNQGLVIYTQEELNNELASYNIKYDNKSNNFYTVPQYIRLDYSMYYYFMKHLIGKYGINKVLDYLNIMIKDYKSSDDNFYKIFGSNIYEEINEFTTKILNKNLI
ncbi:MAG: hypothetical protein WCW29_04235 [Candidatus Paceibacterota bacterium]|jgi:hypothetical protein